MIDEKRLLKFLKTLKEAGAEHISFDDLEKIIEQEIGERTPVLLTARFGSGQESFNPVALTQDQINLLKWMTEEGMLDSETDVYFEENPEIEFEEI